MEKEKWWKRAIVYQIYPLSFKDGNDDGIGDINGIISKLDYLKELGVDVIWLSPVYQSPMDDNGYDISDYEEVNPMFGTKKDLLELIHQAHKRNIKIMMDLVLNHTSDEHPWFLGSKSSKEHPYRDYYIWRDEPTEIDSVFGGTAWTKDEKTNQYYFHLFSKRQPDLNWNNQEVREKLYEMINRWLDLGIDGFRLDVIDLIGKDIDQKRLSDGPYLDLYLKELYENCFKNKDVITVGEMPGISIQRAKDITSETTGFLNMIFQFSHIGLDEIPGQGKWALKPYDLVEMKSVFENLQHELYQKGWNSLFWANHDQPRALTRYGNPKFPYESQTMLATTLYGMQGTPYVYQGEEIGMTGVKFEISQYKDLETLNIYKILKDKGLSEEQIMTSIHAKSRDNSRTPFQWNDHKFAGFSTHQPWIDLNPNYKEINAKKDMISEKSIYKYFKKLFEIRKSYQVFTDGNYVSIDRNHPKLWIYERNSEDEQALIISSFSKEKQIIDFSKYQDMNLLISNDEHIKLSDKTEIPAYYTAIFYQRRDNL